MDQPTNWQLQTVVTIKALYDNTKPPEDADEQLQALEQGGISPVEGPGFEKMIRLIHARDGRRLALSNLYDTFMYYRNAGGKLDQWHFLHTAELYEIQRLLLDYEVEAALIRGTSALEHTLEEEVDIASHWPGYDPAEDYTQFVDLIDWAFEDSVLTYEDLKLHHFVRDVRNEFAHHTWLDRSDEFEILVLAVRAVIYLMDAHVQARFDLVEEVELENFIEGLDAEEEYLREIKSEHGWEFKELKKRWSVPET